MILAADFETTTQIEDCRVWAWAVCEVGTNQFMYGNTLDGFMMFCSSPFENHTMYFHNLKFDGEFIISWLFNHGYKHVSSRKLLEKATFTTLISDKGMFYSIEVCFEKHGKNLNKVTFYDSLKLLPFGVDKIAKGFNLPIRKLEIDYKLYREIGHELTQEEVDYIKNDVTIMGMALDILFKQGMTRMTTGSNALHDYKGIIGGKSFEKTFPIPDYDYDIRQSYRGGWTYLKKGYSEVDIGEGIVLDVNSLYPYVMYYKPMPYGEGLFFKGRYKEDKLYPLYVQMFSCQFELKEGYLPTIQLKHHLAFIPTEYIEDSGDEEVTLCLTSVDIEIFFKHYDVYNISWHSGWKFKSTDTLFREYIDKWMAIKVQASIEKNDALRTIAKLMLNSLYGKFALNPEVRSKIPYMEEGVVKYRTGEKETRKPIYIPMGTFITAWARHTTITAAQQVYDRFVYADTDSLHLIGTEIPPQLQLSDTDLGCWKWESTFKRARYIRAKAYIEEEYVMEKDKTIRRDLPTDLKITCCGMPDRCYGNVTWENFHLGTNYTGKLQPCHAIGGIILKDVDFTLKK